ncbi:MAG: hypothetical protein JWR88_954 [Pseudonocardia sp.]|nr:hypothetical protein [Pseudonocardia sp.]
MSEEQIRPGPAQPAQPAHGIDPTAMPAPPAVSPHAGAETVPVGPDQDVTTTPVPARKAWQGPDPTRLSGLWIGVIISSLVLIVLLIFILQNLTSVDIHFLGASGTLPLGVAMLLAAISGVLLIAIPATGRSLQQRRVAKRQARRVL